MWWLASVVAFVVARACGSTLPSKGFAKHKSKVHTHTHMYDQVYRMNMASTYDHTHTHTYTYISFISRRDSRLHSRLYARLYPRLNLRLHSRLYYLSVFASLFVSTLARTVFIRVHFGHYYQLRREKKGSDMLLGPRHGFTPMSFGSQIVFHILFCVCRKTLT